MDLHSALRTHRSPPFSWSLRALLLMLVLALAGSALAKKADPEPPPPPPEADPEVMAKFDALLAATTADERTTVARDLWFDASGAAFRDTAQVVYADTSDEGVKRYADLCILSANAFGYTAREWEKSYKLVVNFSLQVYGGLLSDEPHATRVLSTIFERVAWRVASEGGDGKKVSREFAALGGIVNHGTLSGLKLGLPWSAIEPLITPCQKKVALEPDAAAALGPMIAYLRSVNLDKQGDDKDVALFGLFLLIEHLDPLTAEEMLASLSINQLVELIFGDETQVDEIVLVLELVRRGKENVEIREPVPEQTIEAIETMGDMMLERSVFADDATSAEQLETIDEGLQALAVRLRTQLGSDAAPAPE